MNRKIIARFSSLLEAEAAVSCLNAEGIPALIDDREAGSMMPHASDALGGFHVSVPVGRKEGLMLPCFAIAFNAWFRRRRKFF